MSVLFNNKRTCTIHPDVHSEMCCRKDIAEIIDLYIAMLFSNTKKAYSNTNFK